MKTVLLSLLLLAAPLLPRPTLAQTPNTAPVDTIRSRNYAIYLNDGLALYGRIIRRDSSNYTVRLRNGLITYVPLDLLKRLGAGRPKTDRQDPATVQKLPGAAADTTVRKGLYANRFGPYLLFNQTAFNPDAGRMYYRNQYGLVNQLDYGLTKFWSVGATVAPFDWFLKEKGVLQNVILNSKITFPVGPWLRLGTNATYRPAYTKTTTYILRVVDQWQLEALASFGNSQQNITLAYGWKLSKAYNGRPAPSYVRIGAMIKLALKLSFVSDNILAGRDQFGNDTGSQFSGVFRLDRRRHSFDVGVLGLVRDEYRYSSFPGSGGSYSYRERKLFPLPYIGYNLLLKSHKGRP